MTRVQHGQDPSCLSTQASGRIFQTRQRLQRLCGCSKTTRPQYASRRCKRNIRQGPRPAISVRKISAQGCGVTTVEVLSRQSAG